MTMHLPCMMTPSITAMSSLNDQYGLMSWCNCSLLSGHPTIIKHFNCCKSLSCAGACYICWIDMHSGTSVDVCIASTQTSIPLIASSLFSLWLCWDSQYAIKILALVCIVFWPCIDVSSVGFTGFSRIGSLCLF